MNKSELRETEKLAIMHKLGMKDTIALSLSALIRSARTNKSKNELLPLAIVHGVIV
jgi:hypothetical protein